MKNRLSAGLFSILRVVVAVGIAFLIACGIILLTSKQPGLSIRTFILAPFADTYTMGLILKESVPLIFTGVAVSLMVRCGQFNMFVEGAFFMGALAGAVLGEKLPQLAVFTPLAAIAISGVLSGAVGYIPAKLKSSLGISEFVTSLMMNFIVYWVCIYLLDNTFADPDYSSLATRAIPDTGRLFYLDLDNEISSSIVIALLFIVLSAIFLYRTKWGYEIRMTGDNPQFANASGIRVQRTITYSQVIGAGIAGAGGAAFLLGNFYRFYWKTLPNYGFDGFIVAIMAGNNPLMIPVVALFFGYLRTGAMEMARLTDVPNEVVYIIQAVMMILAGAQFFLQRLRRKQLRHAAIGGESVRDA